MAHRLLSCKQPRGVCPKAFACTAVGGCVRPGCGHQTKHRQTVLRDSMNDACVIALLCDTQLDSGYGRRRNKAVNDVAQQRFIASKVSGQRLRCQRIQAVVPAQAPAQYSATLSTLTRMQM
jgi:hypothetical protein